MKTYTITSLFSGCGGLDLGFAGNFWYLKKKYAKLRFKTIFANDINKNACLTFSKYFRTNVVCEDINKIILNNKGQLKHSDVVIGGFPCQDFSYAGKRQGLKTSRGNLYKSMCQVIQNVKPKLFLAENVKGLLTIKEGNVFKKILKNFEDLGYKTSYKLLNASNFGVPQNRQRIIVVGTSKYLPKFDFALVKENIKKITVNAAICDLEKKVENTDWNHKWSKAKKNLGQGNSIIKKNAQAPTIRAEHHGNIEFHWNGDRRLSAREAARIQSFPDNFIFYPSTSSAYKQIGNAVPPVFAWNIARAIQQFLDENL